MDEQSDVGSSNKVRLGSLTQLLVSGAQWKGCDDFPAWQSWADHIEKVLAFLEREGRLDSFLLGIQNKKTPQHRDACLAEIYTAFFLVEMGFRILQWEEPPGEGEKKGEFLVGFDGSPEIFVEVKQPGWHSELYPRRQSDNRNLPLEERQRIEPRKQREKYVDGEGGFCEPHKRAMEVVRRNVLPKLKQDFPSLAVVVDDFQLSVLEIPYLSEFVQQEFLKPDYDRGDPADVQTYDRLGGVLFLHLESDSEKIVYRTHLVCNLHCLPECHLPPPAVYCLSRKWA